jgi:hypothetical protein
VTNTQEIKQKAFQNDGAYCGLSAKDAKYLIDISELAVKALEMLADNDFYNSGEFDPCEEARYTLEEIKIKGGTS